MTAHVSNIRDVESWFEVLHTTEKSQTAVMTLKPRGESSEEMNVHQKSDQVVLVVKGEIEAEIGETKRKLKTGDTCIIPAGTPHRLNNPGDQPATTFNVYTPPEYSRDEKG
jgi:mannose-1-phosphate guanylyltransferase/mannose-6-phosphate isomerase